MNITFSCFGFVFFIHIFQKIPGSRKFWTRNTYFKSFFLLSYFKSFKTKFVVLRCGGNKHVDVVAGPPRLHNWVPIATAPASAWHEITQLGSLAWEIVTAPKTRNLFPRRCHVALGNDFYDAALVIPWRHTCPGQRKGRSWESLTGVHGQHLWARETRTSGIMRQVGPCLRWFCWAGRAYVYSAPSSGLFVFFFYFLQLWALRLLNT